MIRLLLISTLCFTMVGCASSPKIKESEQLEDNVSSLHENSLIKDDQKLLFTTDNVDIFRIRFAEGYCNDGVSASECSKRFQHAAASKLSEIYFAADLSTVSATCRTETIVCADMISFETLFRRLHNASIEKSKMEKLSKIENWKQGKLTDEQLKAALHLDFKFENGKVIFLSPSA